MPDEPIEVTAPTIKEAVATATELIESGEKNVTVTATETVPDDEEKTWKKSTAKSLKELTELVAKVQNDQLEVRAMLTRMEDQYKLVISSKPNQPAENTETSQTSVTLPLNPPTDEQTAGIPANGADGNPAVETPQPKPRKRRKI